MRRANREEGEPVTEPLPAPLDPRRDRAFGAFIGLAVGDALGATIEFRQRDSYPPVTDMVGGGPFALKPGRMDRRHVDGALPRRKPDCE